MRFRQALDKIKSKGGIPVVCGVLPRRGLDAEWLSRAIIVNCRSANHCMGNGWTFIDNWNLFYSKDTFYARDGLHLSLAMAGMFEKNLNALQGSFL